MKRTFGNFTTQANQDFPVDAQTLAIMQSNQDMLTVLGNIAGDKAVLRGCESEQDGTCRKEGYVFLHTRDFPDGEILYWEGGAISSGMYLKKEAVPISTQGYEFPQAYTIRSLAPGIGDENYNWDGILAVSTIPQLEQTIATLRAEVAKLTPPPMGIVETWAGAKVPTGYELCEGQQLKISEYQELYAALSSTFNAAYDCNGRQFSTAAGYFRLPDLRGRFIVGYNGSDTEYSTFGKIGGAKKHQLSVSELPAHAHGQNLWTGASGGWKGGGDDSWPDATSFHDRTTPFSSTNQTGGGSAHENRPPFYTLAYIMRVK